MKKGYRLTKCDGMEVSCDNIDKVLYILDKKLACELEFRNENVTVFLCQKRSFLLHYCISKYSRITSVCLIYYVESAADSKKSLGDMKILNMVSKNFTCPPIILKIFRPEITVMVEIFNDFELLGIIEFQIYGFILPILQANLGKILAKIFSNCRYSRVSLSAFS